MMDITNSSLAFIEKEIASRKEQREYLSDDDTNVRGKNLFLKLSQEIEVLGYLKGLALLDKEQKELARQAVQVGGKQ